MNKIDEVRVKLDKNYNQFHKFLVNKGINTTRTSVYQWCAEIGSKWHVWPSRPNAVILSRVLDISLQDIYKGTEVHD